MQDTNDFSQGPAEAESDAIFIVRTGEGAEGDYAICYRVANVPADHRLPGSSSTVAELVDEQCLSAAYVSGKAGGVRMMSFEPQSGLNVRLFYRPK